ncbi:MAG: CDP-glycerol glycerophosphotransferase family protein [Candidatus Krumholzibacteria bacterium]|jgi:hypothetical protein|nr:CDP-glycerol glycerophosphotransferase family protein [Candidatus Krumholzibacteria bacterium]
MTKFLFYIAKYYSIPVVRPLVDFLDAKGGGDYVIYASKKVRLKLAAEKIWQDKKIIASISEGRAFNPDFCISPGNYVDFRLPGIKVGIFHGIGVEKEAHYRIRHFFDVYLTSGPVVTERFERLREKHKYFLVRETGWPKMDYIVNYPSEGLRERHGFDRGKKIVLYAPTFSGRHQSGEDLLPVIPGSIRDGETWVIKLHEFMDKSLAASIRDSRNPNIVFTDACDITPYLHMADVMVSDTSSVIYEFMALDKPVVTYRTAARKDKGIDISSPSELRAALDRVLADPAEHRARRARHMSEVNPRMDGSVSENVFRALEEIKAGGALPAVRKPLNLLRKINLLRSELFKEGYMK